jgi:putative CocE/NonD family hydrolase
VRSAVKLPRRRLAVALLLAVSRCWAAEQNLALHLPATPDDANAAAVMRDLAERVLPVYEESDHQRYLATLSALQLVAGNYPAAYAARQELRENRRGADPVFPIERSTTYDIYARAKTIEERDHVAFASAFVRSYRDLVPRLSDREAYAIISQLETPPVTYQTALQRLFAQLQSKSAVDMPTAIDLIWAYVAYDAFRGIGPLIGALAAEDDARRYIIEPDVLIKTPEGTTLSAVLVRPRAASKPLPTLLEFTIYVDPVNDAKECAAHGYVGVVAYARGKRASRDKFVPFANDGEDARSVIDWITRQSWSDGRIGMYGSAYSGYTEWAAAKHLPAALKTFVDFTPTAPGIDAPKEGNIYHNSAYRWVRYVTDSNALETELLNDDAHWRTLDQLWYEHGSSYWDLMQIYGKPQADFLRWLGHPSYDAYWQQMIPHGKEFSRITIPILTVTGYYDGAEAGALYYFREHYRNNSRADQTLLIGPYDQGVAQRGPLSALQGYRVDANALINLRELRYDWFNYVLMGAPKPAVLQDRVNFEVMGANEWQHARSLEAMSNASLRLYLTPPATGDVGTLQGQRSSAPRFTEQQVQFTDRSDASYRPSVAIEGRGPSLHNAIAFESAPFSTDTELDGALSGQFDFMPNKMDLDITLSLYEQLSSGEYLALFDPPYAFRASYARDRVHRHLLKAGQRQLLPFRIERLMSRKLQAGSRLVVLLGVNKRPDQQINYGTGQDVSDETMGDDRTPLKIRWYSSSYLEIPVRK